MSQVWCEFGHFASSCPERMKKKEEFNLNKIDNFDPSFDKKTVFLNEDGVIPKRFEPEPMEKDV